MNGHSVRLTGVGGLVGGLAGGAIVDCYATGTIAAGWSTGGLVGESTLGSIERSYATGTLLLSEYCTAGGLVGHNHGTRVHGIWNTETSGLSIRDGGLGLGTAEMGDPAMYSLNGWSGDPNWVMEPGDYPHLAWEGKPGRPIPDAVIDWMEGQGTSDNPYRITQAAQLKRLGLASVLWERHFLLATDLDLKDVTLRPIGAARGMEFQGRFHGAGYVLAHLSLGAALDVGLFGCLGANGRVDDLGLRDVRILEGADANAVGALAGLNQGTISRCFATGLIQVPDHGACLGGLVGINEGLVEDCYAQVTFVPERSWFWADHLGGLLGFNRAGQVSHCYATQLGSPVPDAGRVGGLVGYNAPVGWGQSGIIDAGFFLAPADGGGPDNGWGMPLSRQQMQSRESFVGWDFYGRATDGNADVWFMPEGRAPVLAWQAPQTGLAVVPSIVGLVPGQARNVLERAGLRAGSVRTDFHRSVAAGRGISTEPLWIAPAGSAVDLILSAGPYHFDENPGDGTAQNPYQIATAGQLEALADHPALWSRCFVLTGDIDMSGRWFSGALIAPDEDESAWDFQGTPFTGRFEGAGHVIYHLDIIASCKSHLGLFGRIGAGAEVRNLRLDEVRVSGSQSAYVGAIAGHLQGILVGCSARGLVCGGSSVGALVGWNDGTLSECSSEVLVQGPPSESDGRRR